MGMLMKTCLFQVMLLLLQASRGSCLIPSDDTSLLLNMLLLLLQCPLVYRVALCRVRLSKVVLQVIQMVPLLLLLLLLLLFHVQISSQMLTGLANSVLWVTL